MLLGEIVCSHRHLSSAADDSIPVKVSNSQIRSDGTCGPLQVGMVLVLGEGIRVTESQRRRLISLAVLEVGSGGGQFTQVQQFGSLGPCSR